MTVTASKDLAVNAVKGIAGRTTPTNLPRGVEEAGGEDLVFPRYQLVQEKSTMAKQGHKPGSFVNSLTGKSVESFDFVPIKMTKYVDVLRREGAKMVFDHRVFDLKSPELADLRYFNDNKTGDKANANRVIAFSGLVDGQPAVLTFKKTSYDTGKQLLSMIVLSKQDAWAFTYKVSTTETTNAHGTFYVAKVEPSTETPEAIKMQGEYYYALFGGKPSEAVVGTQDETTEEVPF